MQFVLQLDLQKISVLSKHHMQYFVAFTFINFRLLQLNLQITTQLSSSFEVLTFSQQEVK